MKTPRIQSTNSRQNVDRRLDALEETIEQVLRAMHQMRAHVEKRVDVLQSDYDNIEARAIEAVEKDIKKNSHKITRKMLADYANEKGAE